MSGCVGFGNRRFHVGVGGEEKRRVGGGGGGGRTSAVCSFFSSFVSCALCVAMAVAVVSVPVVVRAAGAAASGRGMFRVLQLVDHSVCTIQAAATRAAVPSERTLLVVA